MYTINLEIDLSNLSSDNLILIKEDWEKKKSLKFMVSLWYFSNKKESGIRIPLSMEYKLSGSKLDVYIPESNLSHNRVINGKKIWLNQYTMATFNHLDNEGYYQIKITPLIKQDDINNININSINMYLSVDKYYYPK